MGAACWLMQERSVIAHYERHSMNSAKRRQCGSVFVITEQPIALLFYLHSSREKQNVSLRKRGISPYPSVCQGITRAVPPFWGVMPRIHRINKNNLRIYCGQYGRYSPHGCIYNVHPDIQGPDDKGRSYFSASCSSVSHRL
jgi:hypothetical protein